MEKLVALMSIAACALAGDGKCRALALSGGGNKGAWEAGVLWGLLHYGDPADFAWDVSSGISAGALNTAFAAVWETGTETDMTETLSEIWASITDNSDIYVPWGDSIARALFFEPSLVNTDPGLQFLKDHIEPYDSIKRRFTNGAVDVETGEFVTMN